MNDDRIQHLWDVKFTKKIVMSSSTLVPTNKSVFITLRSIYVLLCICILQSVQK